MEGEKKGTRGEGKKGRRPRRCAERKGRRKGHDGREEGKWMDWTGGREGGKMRGQVGGRWEGGEGLRRPLWFLM